MTYHYVEDYEELTGKKPEPAPVGAMGVEAKVVEAPEKAPAKKATAKAETK